MPTCAAVGCNYRTGSRGQGGGRSLHAFPLGKPDLLKKWLANIGRKGFVPSKYSRLCSDHFLDTCFKADQYAKYLIVEAGSKRGRHLKEDAVPTEFSHRSIPKAREGTLSRIEKREKEQLLQQLLSNPPGDQPIEKPTFLKYKQATYKRKRIPEETVTREDVPPISVDVPSVSIDLPSVSVDVPSVSSGVPSVSVELLDESSPKRRRTTPVSILSTTLKTPSKVTPPVRSWVTPQKAVYGTPRRTRRDHSYFASVFKQSSTQTDPMSDVLKERELEKPSTRIEEPSSELTEMTSSHGDVSPEHQLATDSSTTDTTDDEEEIPGPCDMKKYIIFEQNLDELHRFCNRCGSPVTTMSRFTRGSMVGYNITCHGGHSYVWHSQPVEHSQPVGNLLISAALLTTGGSYGKMSAFADALNLQFFSENSYYRIQKESLLPVIQKVWDEEKTKAIEEVKSLGSVVVAGDARCDSPGHTAKYGSYTLMHADGDGVEATRKIVSMNLVQVSEVKNSNHMEPVGLERCLAEVTDRGLQVSTLATDRHLMISSMMRKEYTQIDHQFDIWHVGKSIVKQLNTKAKTKKFEALRPWIQSVSNYLWWACATCDGDEQLLREKWLSVLHHVVNKHSWNGNQKFHQCAHSQLSTVDRKATKWLDPKSQSFAALKAVVTNKNILKALAHMTKFCHTGDLESFHSMLLKFCPKRTHFHYDAMYSRLMLAAMEWNNTVRKELVDETGKSVKSMVYSKRRKAFVLRTRYTFVKSTHTRRLVERVFTVHKDKIVLPVFRRPIGLPKFVSGDVAKPTKAELEMKFKTRFGK